MTDNKKEIEELLVRFQIENQQLETILLQKQKLSLEKTEVEEALKQIENKKEAYKIVGPLIVKKSSTELKKELEDKKEELDVRIKSLERNEKTFKEMIKKDKEKLEKLVPSLKLGD